MIGKVGGDPTARVLKIVDLYLVSELLLPFLFGVATFASLGMIVGSLFELVRAMLDNGLSVTVAAQVFALRLPSVIVITFPTAMLLATLLAYARLSGDAETVAMRACGMSVYRLVLPALSVGLLVTGATFMCNELVVPASNAEASRLLFQAIDRDKPDFQKDNIIYPEYGFVTPRDGRPTYHTLVRLFYARQFAGGIMRDLTVLDYSQDAVNQVITAAAAVYDNRSGAWTLQDGTVYVVAPDGSYRNVLRFKRQQVKLSERPEQFGGGARPEDLPIAQLSDYIRRLELSQQQVRTLQVSLQQKYAIPVTCFVFALVGATLGLRRVRTSNALGLGLSILIIFGYYLLMFVCQALGQTGVLAPWLGAWAPNLAVGALGGVLLWRTAR
ncbi:LptF/LptG family permease [Gloeobacter morelensis]|uniref:LptF/LptG family permease n=1 Tax=Gloeobacter morelensis MG652769 TaxID=2781736 RepID=A0ABY3PGB8_9CYAN|nr:LptF/LptG family permease [Gloeobacter morelensis]UFP92684.1 LptF/LptG family permease [Gloeobacter morelensis MG652769]